MEQRAQRLLSSDVEHDVLDERDNDTDETGNAQVLWASLFWTAAPLSSRRA